MEEKKSYLTFCGLSEYDRREFEKHFREEETEYEANEQPVRKQLSIAFQITAVCAVAALFFALGAVITGKPTDNNTSVGSEYVSTVSEQTESVNSEPVSEVSEQTESVISESVSEAVVSEKSASNKSVTEIMNYDVGELVNFGKYEWYIISKSKSGVTLLSKKPVVQREYNDSYGYYSWNNCDLRQWLNEDFYDEFTVEEQDYIVKTTCENKDDGIYDKDVGIDTEDHVFLLSLDEAEAVDVNIRAIGVFWWLRSVGDDGAAGVNGDGSLNHDGDRPYFADSVRPALNLEF